MSLVTLEVVKKPFSFTNMKIVSYLLGRSINSPWTFSR